MIAAAGPAAWCKGQKFEVTHEDVYRLADGDPRSTLETLAKYQCSDSEDANAHRADLDKARDAWGAKYGLRDADWADVIVWRANNSITLANEVALANRTFATLSPIDQYIAIERGDEKVNAVGGIDNLYMSDILDAQLSDVGRVGVLDWCLKDSMIDADEQVVRWAACQADIDKFDPNKVFEQVRGDTAHDGFARMSIRVEAHDMVKRIKAVADKKAALIKQDAEYGKVFAVAEKARTDWTRAIGANAKLLELTRDLEGAQFFHSRKLYEGCEVKTHDALVAAAGKIPASAFAATAANFDKASGTLAKNPELFVAAVGYIVCQPKTNTARYLAKVITGAAGARGPRSAALDAIMGTTFTFDDTTKKGLRYPSFWARPYRLDDPSGVGEAGVIATVKPGKDGVVVTFEKKKRMEADCIKEHQGRPVRIRDSGSIEYEIICDKTAMVAHEASTMSDTIIDPAYAKWLKPGVMIAFTGRNSNGASDVIALWPSKSAKAPSWLLGATVK
jgi:hypothetical protein